MRSPEKNPTRNTRKKQRQFGKVMVELEPKLAKLSHLEAHVYLMLTIHAIRNPDDPNVGCVNISKSELARHMGVDPKSVRVGAKALFKRGLLVEGKASCPTSWGVIPHLVGGHPLESRGSSPGKSSQSQQSKGSYDPPRRIDVDEVKTVKKARARKSAPVSPLDGLVSWDKEKRQVRFEKGGEERLQLELQRLTDEEGRSSALSAMELNEGWGRLNGHLIGNPFKTSKKTLPSIVLNWFQNDLRRKSNHRGNAEPKGYQGIRDFLKEEEQNVDIFGD